MVRMQPYDRAEITRIGTVTTAPDGYSPILEHWSVNLADIPDDRKPPMVDAARHTAWGWPIHELAQMAQIG